MRIKFWGTRGTRPTPGRKTLRYGGNTTCVEVRDKENNLIIIDPKTSVLDCIVRNLSPCGALLLVSSLAVPDRFDLVFSANHARHACRVAWRSSDRVGVEFG